MSEPAIILLVLAAVAFGVSRLVNHAAKPVIHASIYSASDTAGGYGIPPDPTLHTYSPTPCELISEYGHMNVVSHSINGLKLSELLEGGSVALGVPGIGTEGCTVVKFEEQLKTDPSPIIVLGAGMVDCLFTSVSSTDYMLMVDKAVNLIHCAGKMPVLRGYNRFAVTDLMTNERLARRDQFNAGLAKYASDNGIHFIDVGSAEFSGLSDLAPDQIHPTLDYHKRIAQVIAGKLAVIGA
jgi:hypothetical protein